MKNKPIFCFIDDSRFELEVFSRNIIPVAPEIDFFLGHAYDDVVRQMAGRQPCLFLLDLYGREEGAPEAPIPSREDLAARIDTFGSLDQVYQGLSDFPGDKTNEYLKRLFHLTDSWRRLFLSSSRQAGQSTAYGLSNLEAARRDYPFAAAVGYTRKSMIVDAVELWEARADGLFLKPDGPSDQAIHQATARTAADLVEKWGRIVAGRLNSYYQEVAVKLYRAGLGRDLSLDSLLKNMPDEVRGKLEPWEIRFFQAAGSWF